VIRLCFLCVLLLTSDVNLVQSTPPKASSSGGSSTDLASKVESLQQTIAQMQKQMAAQQREIETLKAQSKFPAAMSIPNESLPTHGEGAAHHATYSALQSQIASGAANMKKPAATQDAQEKPKPEEELLGSFKVAGAELELGGFVDFENIYRTANTGNNIATAFAGIPFSNTPQGHVFNKCRFFVDAE
jgi:hypothetical protein